MTPLRSTNGSTLACRRCGRASPRSACSRADSRATCSLVLTISSAWRPEGVGDPGWGRWSRLGRGGTAVEEAAVLVVPGERPYL